MNVLYGIIYFYMVNLLCVCNFCTLGILFQYVVPSVFIMPKIFMLTKQCGKYHCKMFLSKEVEIATERISEYSGLRFSCHPESTERICSQKS